MKQKLLTKEILKRLPPLYSQEEKGMEAVAQVRFFHAYGSGTWYATEFDGVDTLFGWACIQEGELGYFSLKELESLEARVGGKIVKGLQAVERDVHFLPTRLCDIHEVTGQINGLD